MNIVFQGVPSDKVDAVWPYVEDMIATALNKNPDGFFSPDDIKRLCADKSMQLWIGRDDDSAELAIVTQILIYPRKKVLTWVIVSGKNRRIAAQWWMAKDVIENYARENGCDAIMGYGRRGWKRKYPHLDYHNIHTVWLQELNDA